MPHPINYKRVSELFTADFYKGILINKSTGKPVGHIAFNGSTRHRVLVSVDGKSIPLHRVLWVLWNECDVPKGFDVKHINKNQMDNRLINLTVASRTGSLKHSRPYRDDISTLIAKAQSTIGQPLPYTNVERFMSVSV